MYFLLFFLPFVFSDTFLSDFTFKPVDISKAQESDIVLSFPGFNYTLSVYNSENDNLPPFLAGGYRKTAQHQPSEPLYYTYAVDGEYDHPTVVTQYYADGDGSICEHVRVPTNGTLVIADLIPFPRSYHQFDDADLYCVSKPSSSYVRGVTGFYKVTDTESTDYPCSGVNSQLGYDGDPYTISTAREDISLDDVLLGGFDIGVYLYPIVKYNKWSVVCSDFPVFATRAGLVYFPTLGRLPFIPPIVSVAKYNWFDFNPSKYLYSTSSTPLQDRCSFDVDYSCRLRRPLYRNPARTIVVGYFPSKFLGIVSDYVSYDVLKFLTLEDYKHPGTTENIPWTPLAGFLGALLGLWAVMYIGFAISIFISIVEFIVYNSFYLDSFASFYFRFFATGTFRGYRFPPSGSSGDADFPKEQSERFHRIMRPLNWFYGLLAFLLFPIWVILVFILGLVRIAVDAKLYYDGEPPAYDQ